MLSGSGLSSSAAYEVLVGNILNRFCCGGALSPVDIAKIGQYAENVYFGKPCGLMDQMGSSVGGAVAIDFADPADPVVRKVDYDFSQSGHALCIVDTGSCHADLTDDYADITREMGAVAAHFGKSGTPGCARGRLPRRHPRAAECGAATGLCSGLCTSTPTTAGPLDEADALEAGDFDRFLALVNASGLSSALHLQNTWSVADPRQQAIPLALAIGPGAAGGHRGHPGPRRRLCRHHPGLCPRGKAGLLPELAWRNCWGQVGATSSTSAPRAAAWCWTDPIILLRGKEGHTHGDS